MGPRNAAGTAFSDRGNGLSWNIYKTENLTHLLEVTCGFSAAITDHRKPGLAAQEAGSSKSVSMGQQQGAGRAVLPWEAPGQNLSPYLQRLGLHPFNSLAYGALSCPQSQAQGLASWAIPHSTSHLPLSTSYLDTSGCISVPPR